MAHQCTLQYAAICCLGHFDCSVSSCDLSVLSVDCSVCLGLAGVAASWNIFIFLILVKYLILILWVDAADGLFYGEQCWSQYKKYFDLFISFKKIAVTHFCCRSDKS